MAAVGVSAFRVTGFVVPIHVKNNRASSLAFHFADPAWESMNCGKAPPSGGFHDRVRLPFGGEPAVMREGIRRLAQAWEEYRPLAAGQSGMRLVV